MFFQTWLLAFCHVFHFTLPFLDVLSDLPILFLTALFVLLPLKNLLVILNILTLEPLRVFYHIFSSRGANSDCIIPTSSSTQCLFLHMIHVFTINSPSVRLFFLWDTLCALGHRSVPERFCCLFLSEPWGSLTGPRTVLIIQVGVPVSQIVFMYIFWTFCCGSSMGVLISHKGLSFFQLIAMR